MAPDERRRAIVDAVVPLLLAQRRRRHHPADRRGRRDRRGHDLPGLPRQAGAADGRRRGGHQPGRAAVPTSRPPSPALDALRDRVRGHRRAARGALGEGDGRDDGAAPDLDVAAAERHATSTSAGPAAGVRRRPTRRCTPMLTEVFEPHRDELTVDPATAAVLLRTLVLGSRHPGANPRTGSPPTRSPTPCSTASAPTPRRRRADVLLRILRTRLRAVPAAARRSWSCSSSSAPWPRSTCRA